MIVNDTYKTISSQAEGIYTEKRSKFIAIAIPVRSLEEIKEHLDKYQKQYYDARHVCYAYMLGLSGRISVPMTMENLQAPQESLY